MLSKTTQTFHRALNKREPWLLPIALHSTRTTRLLVVHTAQWCTCKLCKDLETNNKKQLMDQCMHQMYKYNRSIISKTIGKIQVYNLKKKKID